MTNNVCSLNGLSSKQLLSHDFATIRNVEGLSFAYQAKPDTACGCLPPCSELVLNLLKYFSVWTRKLLPHF